jgi:hypothetical protein
MNWKTELRLGDIEPGRNIEVLCRKCGYSWLETVDDLLARPGFDGFMCDEAETALVCRQRGCGGRVKIFLNFDHLMEPFIGGLP